jgi:hypothetical protein
MKLSLDVARFRELRRLESAFQRTDRRLIELLSEYEPAQAIGFTSDELKELLMLRGRASHAQSKAGCREPSVVERECERRVPRRENLVERVLLTKQDWGSPSTAVEELAHVQANVQPTATVGEKLMAVDTQANTQAGA